MEYCKNCDGITACDVKNTIGEALCEDSPDLGLAAKLGMKFGIFHCTENGSADFRKQFLSQSSFLALVPQGGFGDVRFGFGSYDELAAHA